MSDNPSQETVSQIMPEAPSGESGFMGKPEHAALFAATFKDLPVIREIEQQWEELGLQPGDPSRMDLQLHALFDRRMEIIAGAFIHEMREQAKEFKEMVEAQDELASNLRACQQQAGALRQELDGFASAAATIARAHLDLQAVLAENTSSLETSTAGIGKAVKVCTEKSVSVVILQALSPMLALSFGVLITLGIVFYLSKHPAALSPLQRAQSSPRFAPSARPQGLSSANGDRRQP